MKGDPQVMEALQEHLTRELTTVDQFSQHAFRHEHQGRAALAQSIEAAAVRSTTHVRTLSFRILDLEGMPNAQRRHPLRQGETLEEMLQNDLAFELQVRDGLNEGIGIAGTRGDWTSQRMLQDFFIAREPHVFFLERQLDQLRS
ncbi:ferritin-like domain-containing protein [Streptomyces beigongshangae]|uniref:ferritin-like domain-containing protein n=1 Tax=Streptomyces beigongshangae TaxID=2841597 RepID=UPI001C848182|nr:ferritin-like domain-containing protein [Streptomyces sp. REN17]